MLDQPEETLDDLLINDIKVFQACQGYRFAIDAVLLAHFPKLEQVEKIIDVGTGSGVIPLLLSQRTQSCITGVEIQAALAQRARKSVKYNALQDQIDIIQADINHIEDILPKASWDLVISNPPYWKVGEGKLSSNQEEAMARHEISLTLAQLLNRAAYLLKPRGKLALIQRADRLQEIMELMSVNHLTASRIRTIHARRGAQARMILAEAVKGSRPGLKILPPIYIYEEDGTYTREVLAMYQGERKGY
jgi:tRNA1Val (adenine37-N6)-methyltransferase